MCPGIGKTSPKHPAAVYGPPRGLKMHSSVGGSYANTCRGFLQVPPSVHSAGACGHHRGAGAFSAQYARAWDVNKSQHAPGLFIASENSGNGTKRDT